MPSFYGYVNLMSVLNALSFVARLKGQPPRRIDLEPEILRDLPAYVPPNPTTEPVTISSPHRGRTPRLPISGAKPEGGTGFYAHPPMVIGLNGPQYFTQQSAIQVRRIQLSVQVVYQYSQSILFFK